MDLAFLKSYPPTSKLFIDKMIRGKVEIFEVLNWNTSVLGSVWLTGARRMMKSIQKSGNGVVDMPVNMLRKHGARMSLQEALDRVEKLKRLSTSSNPHEAALAAMRLKSFDVNAARSPRVDPSPSAGASEEEGLEADQPVEILDEWPQIPYETLGELEAHQPQGKGKVNWDELHFELLKIAGRKGADALIHIQLKGTADQKILAATALKFLTPKEVLDIQQAKALEMEEKAYFEAQKERRDEASAPNM